MALDRRENQERDAGEIGWLFSSSISCYHLLPSGNTKKLCRDREAVFFKDMQYICSFSGSKHFETGTSTKTDRATCNPMATGRLPCKGFKVPLGSPVLLRVWLTFRSDPADTDPEFSCTIVAYVEDSSFAGCQLMNSLAEEAVPWLSHGSRAYLGQRLEK